MFWRRFYSTTWRFERLKGYITTGTKHHQFVNVKQMLMEKLRYRESGDFGISKEETESDVVETTDAADAASVFERN